MSRALPVLQMRIMAVDDSEDARLLLQEALNGAGYADVVLAGSAAEAFQRLGMTPSGGSAHAVGAIFDLILLDFELPGLDGVEACRRIHSTPRLRSVPIIMVTAHSDETVLERAFAAGAVDFVTKPIRLGELLARIRAALDRQRELAQHVAHERDLEFMNSHDALTELPNRRRFQWALGAEWRRAARAGAVLSVVGVDVDNFHAYNETYGHGAGDHCLKAIAQALQGGLHREGDIAARQGGEEFLVLLPNTDEVGASGVAEDLRRRIEALAIPHAASSCAPYATASFGVASVVPSLDAAPEALLAAADQALYAAKAAGRNRVSVATRRELGPAASSDAFVLVVDDDADARELLCEALEGRGYHTAAAADGKEALEILRSRPTRPHVILLDRWMPVMDGAQFRVQQALDPLLATVPVVMVTAASRDEAGLPAAGYIAKPIHLPALFELLELMCPHGAPGSAYHRIRK